mgnify:CR=1 FL=1
MTQLQILDSIDYLLSQVKDNPDYVWISVNYRGYDIQGHKIGRGLDLTTILSQDTSRDLIWLVAAYREEIDWPEVSSFKDYTGYYRYVVRLP